MRRSQHGFPNRRRVLSGATSLLASTAAGPVFGHRALAAAAERSKAEDGATSLGTLAIAKGIDLGASFAVHELDQPYGQAYAAAYLRDARTLTSELSFKMSTLRPAADTLDFAPADRLVEFATRNRLKLRAHTLIWNDALPQWIHRLGPDEVRLLFEAHIMTMVERYRGRVWAWDVVNEPIGPWDRLPGNLRKGPFLTAFGESYIARAFRAARALDGSAILVLNEAQTESDDENGKVFRDSLLALLKRLKADAVPIDAVGLQSHLFSDKPYDFAKFVGFLDEIASLGFAIHITELDVNDRAFAADIRQRDAAVADLYRRFLTAVLPHPAVKALTFWQLADHTSWLWYEATSGAKLRREPRPLLLDKSFHRKPAWFAVASALKAMPPR
ncbi:MAG: endo-1,4-beta-xylanase [Hyphomicrobiaceae bacterium]